MTRDEHIDWGLRIVCPKCDCRDWRQLDEGFVCTICGEGVYITTVSDERTKAAPTRAGGSLNEITDHVKRVIEPHAPLVEGGRFIDIHTIDIKVRANGKDYWYEGDWLKKLYRLVAAPAPPASGEGE